MTRDPHTSAEGPLGQRLLIGVFLLTLPLVTLRIRGADEIEYFSYLHSLLFDGDLDFGNEYRHFFEEDPQGLAGFKATFLDRREPTTGRHINFAPVGSALLWSPFYLLAHGGVLLARATGVRVAADGLSRPYVAAVCYGSAAYGLLGLLLIRSALLRWGRFAEGPSTASVLAVWFATPVLYYMTLAPAFSHACSLFAVSLLLWLWLWAREREEGPLDWALVGLAGGLASLVREQDLLFLVVPAGHLAWETLRRRAWAFGLVRGLALGVAAALVLIPQLLAYRALNGRYGPSVLVARKMDYSSPHFLQVLFDPGHGLFLWSPILLAAIAGLLLALLRRRDAPVALLSLALLLQVWIIGSVESWTQAGAFGSRRFVGATPVFAWGLAALLSAAMPRLGRASVAGVLGVFAWWNLSLMVQFGLRLMDRQRLQWPQVAVNQFTEVPPRLGHTALLFFMDRERLVKESR